MMLKIQIQSCQCIIRSNIVKIILKQQEVYGFIHKMKPLILMLILQILIILLIIFLIFQVLKAKLLGNIGADNKNGILKNATIALPLKFVSNFWRSLEMPLINCKIELKLKQAKYCIFSAAGADNVNNIDSINIIFTIKDTRLYVLLITLPARDNQKVSSKFLSKGFERSVYWNEYKTKSKNKNTKNEYRYFLETAFIGINRQFVLIYTNEGDNAKRFNAPKINYLVIKYQA